MSFITKTICDGCGNELNGGIESDKDLFITMISAKGKNRLDFCYKCGRKIIDSMPNFKSVEKDGDGE